MLGLYIIETDYKGERTFCGTGTMTPPRATG